MLFRSSLRWMIRHPWQIVLCVLGVALGVAVVVAIDLANASARRAFQLAGDTVAGQATHQILGGPAGLPETIYPELRRRFPTLAAAPIVEGYVTAPALGPGVYQLFGIDPFAEAPFRPYLAGNGAVDLAALLIEPGAALLARANAERAGVQLGDTLPIQIGARASTVQVVGVLEPADDLSRRALAGMIAVDIASAQELLGSVGRLSRIDLIVPESFDLAALTPLLPPGVTVQPVAARAGALQQMTAAFELNLTALSLLALIVGMFLIYNTMTFSVVQRRSLWGTLRCVGVSRGQLAGLVTTEALLISLLGVAGGLALGVALGRGLVGLVTQTINDLYFVVTVRDLTIEPAVLLKGAALGVVATLLAAFVPALEAMYTPPRTVLRRSSIEERARRAMPRLAGVGIGLLALGGGLLAAPAPAGVTGLYLAFGGLFAVVIAGALLTPLALVGLMSLLRPVLGRVLGLLGRMAARDVVASLSRTAVAVAALMVAVSVTIGVGIMIGSFRQTVINWLEQSLVADIYLSPPSNVANRIDTTLDPALPAALAALPAVESITTFRSVQIDLPTGPTTLVAVGGATEQGRRALRFQQGGDAATWAAWERGAVLISEPLAFRSGLGVGDVLTVRTDRGLRDLPIAGVYYDYTSDRGVVRINETVYRALWDDPAISSLALYVRDGYDIDVVIEQVRATSAAYGMVLVNSSRALREGTLAVFDRTFAITSVLQLLATIVAFIGILSALMALQLERTRELGVLRATGLTPGQLWGTVLSQTGLMGLAAGLLSAPLGLALALVLTYVINKRSFGWTLELAIDPALFGQALVVAITAALLAGIWPALRMSRVSPAVALRDE
ncbi:FtsX-like permease family protein [Chloroflexus sp.]|uniref:FtsX-like permease family protein n=1 Tax=Chloroflexus sp. TaxID=1904827 RepID=UPI00298F175D|nr:FtsX-like permease family protein [Chloroflexus sp.]MDW8402796.1 FtsX-like permease family protein [Chloroflexus sp.]